MRIDNNYNLQNYTDLLGTTNNNSNDLFSSLLSTLTNTQNHSCCSHNNTQQEETNINIGSMNIDTEKNILTLDDISLNFGNRNITISNLVINNSNLTNNLPEENNDLTTEGTNNNDEILTENLNNQIIVEQPKVESFKVQNAINLAYVQIGKDYIWGANGPDSFDCSGLVKYLYNESFGINLPRVSYDQAKVGSEVSKENLQAGDLVFFDTMDKGRVSHVGIYIGNDEFIHAANSKKGVIKSTLSGHYESKYITARRP